MIPFDLYRPRSFRNRFGSPPFPILSPHNENPEEFDKLAKMMRALTPSSFVYCRLDYTRLA